MQGKKIFKTNQTNELIEYLCNEIMSEDEKKLMKLVFCHDPSQEDLDNILKGWNIEEKGINKALLLAYFMKQHPNLKLTTDYEFKIKSLLLNYRCKNIQTITHYLKIGKELNRNGIIPVILKGGAMKFLRPEFPREMGDIDILVKETEWIKSAEIAKQLGYWYKKPDIHSIDIHESKTTSEYGILDIHRFIYMETGKEKNWIKDLYKRAELKDVFKVKTLVPSYEDLMFITLTNLARNLSNKTSQAGILFSLFDCKFFLENKPDFNWQIVIDNAKKTGTELQLKFAIKFITHISEDVIPEEIRNNSFFNNGFDDYAGMVIFKRFYYMPLQQEARDLKLNEVIKNPSSWIKYVNVKIKYKSIKFVEKNPKLINILFNHIKNINFSQIKTPKKENTECLTIN